MIVVDTSALIAVVLDEAAGPACKDVLERAEQVAISAGTLAEALMVAGRRNVRDDLAELLDRLPLDVRPVLENEARRAANVYDRWGKGVHSAALNYGDCFAYALAEEHDCPLLYIGNDFAQTDIQSALSTPT